MRKIGLLLGVLVFSLPAFSYELKGIVCSGASYSSSGNYKLTGVVGIVGYKVPWVAPLVGVEEQDTVSHIRFYVHNYPNPTGYGTWIEYGIPKETSLSFKVYDLAGRSVRTLIAGNQKPGIYRVYWDGTDDSGKSVSAGIYFYHMDAGDFKATRKLTILR